MDNAGYKMNETRASAGFPAQEGLNASATVEASFIFPVMIFVIIAYLWLVFFMYARIKLEADADMALNEAVECYVITGKTGEDVIPEDLTERYIKGYPYCTLTEKSLKVDNNDLLIDAGLRLRAPEHGLIGRFTKGMRTASVECGVRYFDRAQIKRYACVAKKTLKQGESQ